MEVVAAGEGDDLGTVYADLIQLICKLPVLVVPEDDPTLLKLRQRCCKAPVQILYNLFGIHPHASSFIAIVASLHKQSSSVSALFSNSVLQILTFIFDFGLNLL